MRAAVLAACAVVALGACTSSGPSGARETTPPPSTAPATTPPAMTAAPTPSRTPSRTPSPTPRTDLADGRQYARLRSIDLDRRTLVVDVVQFLTGKEAERAAREDGYGEIDNDYYVRNQNTRLRTLTFVPSVPVTVNTLGAEEHGGASTDRRITLAKLKSYFDRGQAQQRLWWLTLRDGLVTEIHEQYLP